MNKNILAALTCATLTVTAAMPQRAEAKDACKTLLCMAGKPGIGNGSISGGCSGAVSDFFNIRVFDIWGYNPGRTATKRTKFLNQCSGAAMNEDVVAKIITLYGTLIFDPT